MADLKTKYMGIELKNPIIVGASNLVTSIENLKALEAAGAGAIVYKSLFEEQIHLENKELDDQLTQYDDRSAEMTKIFPDIEHAGTAEHLLNLKRAKEAVNIPVIGSLNATYDVSWLDYAKDLASTGIDGLELNFYAIPNDFNKSAEAIVKEQIEALTEIKEALSIPVSVKLSPYYTNILNVVSQMDKAGADAVVLFNRLFQPEINVETEEHIFPWNLSGAADSRLPLRFAGLLHGEINADVASSGGIYESNDVIQMLLAGATTVQIVSTLYRNKIKHITKMVSELEAWMDKKGYADIEAFRGKLSKKNSEDKYAYKRAQYVDILYNSNTIFEKYPMH